MRPRRGDGAGGHTLSRAAIHHSGVRDFSWLDHHPGRSREQPQGRRPRHPQGADHGLHGRVGVGEVVDRVRHDRGRVPAAAERDDARVRAELPAALRAAGRGCAGGAQRRDHRRPAADRRQRAQHRRHVHRRLHDAARPVQPRRRTERRHEQQLLLQRPGRDVPDVRGDRLGRGGRRGAIGRRRQVAQRGRDRLPQLRRRLLVLEGVHRLGVLRPRRQDRRLHARAACSSCSTRPRARSSSTSAPSR